jgi:hypothetical protein
MPAPKRIAPTVLSERDLTEFRQYFGGSSAHLERLAQLLAQFHGKDVNQLTSITFMLDHTHPQSGGQPLPQAKRIWGVCKAGYDDGTCGCVADPPGISYPCSCS